MASGDELQLGDRVQLKSGGPVMTVSEDEGDSVWCQWFEKSELKSSSFKRHVLAKVRDRGD